MAAAPTARYYFGFGSTWKTADADIDWTEVTDYVLESEGTSINRGRSSELDEFRAGRCSFVLNNTDGRFDPEHSSATLTLEDGETPLTLEDGHTPLSLEDPSGGHYGMLKPGVPVKVEAVVNAVTFPVFRGFVDDWPQDYPTTANTFATVPIHAVDGFGKLATAGTPASVYVYEITQDTPAAYWGLDERTGFVLADTSGNGHDGRFENTTQAQVALIEDNGHSVDFPHVGEHRGLVVNRQIVTGYPFTIEAWIKAPRDSAAYQTILWGTKDTTLLGAGSIELAVPNSSHSSANSEGALVMRIAGAPTGAGRGVKGTTAVCDDTVHHVVGVANSTTSISLYVDGVAETVSTWSSSTAASGADIAANLRRWTLGNSPDAGVGDFGLDGLLDAVAIYNSELSAARILAHYNAGTAPWDGDTSGERLGRVLDLVGWPSDLRDIATGNTTMGWATLGQSALTLAKSVEAAEQGRLFISRSGDVSFLDRYYHLQETAGTTSQATLSDDGSDTAYSGLSFDGGAAMIYNRVRGSRPGGATIEAYDQDSIDTHGEQVDSSLSGIQVTDDLTVRDACEYRLLRYKEPQRRVRPLTVNLLALAKARQADVLGLELGYRVTLERTPPSGSAFAQETIVEGVTHSIRGAEWTTTLTLSPVDTRSYFVLDTSTLDGSDVLAY